MMIKDILRWPEKLNVGKQIGQKFFNDHQSRLAKDFKKIAFVGMGGSGIAGRIIKTFLDKKTTLITTIIDSPHIPLHIDHETLTFVLSYSGNTWETLRGLDELIAKKLPTIVIAHTGQALDKAAEEKIPFVTIPESLSPRSSLGYFLGFLVEVLELLTLLPPQSYVARWIDHSHQRMPQYSHNNYFKPLLSMLAQKDFFHCWGVTGDSSAAAYRAQTQFNENSKVQAVSSSIPELCHNLLVGFSSSVHEHPILLFATDFLSPDLKLAIEAISDILTETGVHLYKVPVFGDTFEEQLFDMILWADFASCYLGVQRGVDVVSVNIITDLKEKHKQKGIR